MDPYVTLGLPDDAGPDEIRQAYRRLVREYHPDRNSDPEAVNRFQQVVSAYESLSGAAAERFTTANEFDDSNDGIVVPAAIDQREQRLRQAFEAQFARHLLRDVGEESPWVGLLHRGAAMLLLFYYAALTSGGHSPALSAHSQTPPLGPGPWGAVLVGALLVFWPGLFEQQVLLSIPFVRRMGWAILVVAPMIAASIDP